MKLKAMKCTITCKQISCSYTHPLPLGGFKGHNIFFPSKRSRVAYIQINRKIGHAHTMVIYTMGGLGGGGGGGGGGNGRGFLKSGS